MQYCIYLRKSRADIEAEARGEGETLARHEHILVGLAGRRQLPVSQIYREIVSGETIAARPVMQQLLSEVAKGMWAGVLVMETSRLARGDTKDQGIVAQTFRLSNTLIITPEKVYNPQNEADEEYFEFELFMSRREYKLINRRMQRGKTAAVKEGKFVGNRTPYGYERVKLKNDSGYTLAPIPEQAEVVRMIFEWYTEGEILENGTRRRLGVTLIAKKLNSLGILSATYGKWVSCSVRDLINNPVYVGMLRWNWRRAKKSIDNNGEVILSRPRNPRRECLVVNGLHPAIVARNTWDKAQKIMAQVPAAPIRAGETVKNPLLGLIICSRCGHKMTRRPYSGKNTKQPPSLMCRVEYCDQISSPLHIVEKAVIDGLSAWLSEYKVKWKQDKADLKNTENKKQSSAQRLITKHKAELEILQKQMDKIHDLLEQEVYTTDEYLDRNRSISERMDEHNRAIEALEAEVAKHKKNITAQNIVPKISRLISVYDSLSNAKEKNDMLKEVIEKILYDKQVRGRWHNDPADFTLVIYTKLPDSKGFAYNPYLAQKALKNKE